MPHVAPRPYPGVTAWNSRKCALKAHPGVVEGQPPPLDLARPERASALLTGCRKRQLTRASEYDSRVLANREARMRGSDERSGELFSYVDIEDRVPAGHPLRLIRRIVNEVLVALDGEFTKLYADGGRPSIAPERLLRALLLQVFYTIRSERQLMEQLHYNFLYRWFVGLGVDEPVWVPTVFTKNRERLLQAE